MRHHDLDYALYHPIPNAELRIGDCGYFDGSGHWNRIGNITEAGSLKRYGLQPTKPEDLDKAPTNNSIAWGPLTTKHVMSETCEVKAEVTYVSNIVMSTQLTTILCRAEATNIPLAAKVGIRYSSTSKYGGVLVALPPINREAYYLMRPFKDWVEKNIRAPMDCQIWRDLKENGLWVITQTYATRKYTLTTWNNAEKSVYLGLNAELRGAGVLGSQAQWYEGRSVEGWRSDEATVSPA